MSDLVRATAVFDPAVRDITMTKDESRELLQNLHEKLNSSRFSSTVFGVGDERTTTDGGSGGPSGGNVTTMEMWEEVRNACD